jgi:hypothetical protein
MRLRPIKQPVSMVLLALLLPGVLAAQCTTNGAISGNRRYRCGSARYQREAEEHGERLPPFAKLRAVSCRNPRWGTLSGNGAAKDHPMWTTRPGDQRT